MSSTVSSTASSTVSSTPSSTPSVEDTTTDLFTEGAYMMIDLGGGIIYLKQLSAVLEADTATGHVGAII